MMNRFFYLFVEAYFPILAFKAFFFSVISSRGFTGIASMRRASSSRDMAGSSGVSLWGRGLLMGVPRG